jgi:hypothetical protein
VLRNNATDIRDTREITETNKKTFKVEPIVRFSISQDNSIFSNGNTEQFNALTGIDVDKPEIIALTEFLPCYSEDLKLNRTGQFFQAKQDALLVSCVDSLSNVFESINKQKDIENTSQTTIAKSLESNRSSLYEFCETIENNINSFMAGVEDTKRSFYFKNNFSYLIPFTINVPYDLRKVSSLDEMTNVPQDVWKNWTTTKTWLQMCLEFKEALKNGTSSNDSLFVINPLDGVSVNNSINAYSLNEPSNRKNKLGFNENQIQTLSVFNATLDVSNEDLFNSLKIQLKKLFSTREYSVLNVPMRELVGDDTTEKSKSIARLSYLITRELNYSSELRKLSLSNSPVVVNFNYPTENLNKENNIIFWNFVAGKTGKDITEIPKNPDSLNSLTALAQRVETLANKTYEILTFEKTYINDDISSSDGTSRNAVLTPGLTYYIDGALTSENFFSPTSAKSLRENVRTSLDSLKDIFSSYDGNSQFLFDNFINARVKNDIIYTKPPQSISYYSNASLMSLSLIKQNQLEETLETLVTDEQLATDNNASSQLELSYKNINKIIRNPLHLIRFLENQLLTADFLPRFNQPADIKNLKDISHLIISFALKNLDKSYNDNNLLSLIYMYVLIRTDALLKNNQGVSTNNNKLNHVTDKIKNYFIDYFSNNKGTLSFPIEVDYVLSPDTPGNLTSLNKIAKILASIAKEFNKVDPDNFEDSITINPFKTGVDISKSFYSGVQKESVMVLIFFLCCLMINEVNFQSIDNLIFSNGNHFFSVIKDREPIEKKEYFNNEDTVTVVGGREFNLYRYDDIILEAEGRLSKEIVSLKRMSAWFVCYLTMFEKKLTNFINQLENTEGFFSNVWAPISFIINDDAVATKMLNVEQLNLIKSKLAYMKTRLSSKYDSGLKNLTPYFVSLKNKDQQALNSMLPLEDLHIASWNFLLKEYLKKQEFLSNRANNLKILSVGIPQKLYQKLQKPTNATTLKDSIGTQNIVSINVYLVDHLRPTLIHKPKKFIFDLSKFPIRILNYYLDGIGALQKIKSDREGLESLELINYLPFFNLQNFQNISEIKAEDAADLMDSNNNEFSKYFKVLNEEQIRQLRDNHMNSLFFEEYLKFTSGVSLDEHSFYNFEKMAKAFDPSMLEIPAVTDGSIEYFKNTIFVGTDEIKRSLIIPKKFDRVFHVSFDPEDFEIDEVNTKTFDGVNVINYYVNQGTIVKISETEGYKRAITPNSDVEFNSYYVELEVIA